MPDIARIQKELETTGVDGWLLYDFRNRDPIAYGILGMDFGKFTTRRWFYWIPARGNPVRLVSAVEAGKLDSLPGEKKIYLSWRELHASLKAALGSAKKVAMQYSPEANVPYVSVVDAGTIELIRSFGYEVVTSAGLVQTFQALLDEEAYRTHLDAAERVQRIKDEAFAHVGSELRAGRTLTQYDVQQFIVRRFGEEGLNCMNEFPIVGTNEQPADPHFEPTPQNARPIRKGDTLLIDLWAKIEKPGAVFYDITWCGFVGNNPPAKYVEIFNVVRDARNAALEFIQARQARLRVGGGRRLPGGRRESWLRTAVRAPHRALHRRRRALERRQHRQPGDARRPAAGSRRVLLHRTGHLPRRGDGGALRDQRVHHARWEGGRGGRDAEAPDPDRRAVRGHEHHRRRG